MNSGAKTLRIHELEAQVSSLEDELRRTKSMLRDAQQDLAVERQMNANNANYILRLENALGECQHNY